MLLAARELGWLAFPLPERKRQTEKYFAHEFGFVVGSAMWGLHIGLGFTTHITYGGFWMLVAADVAIGDPLYGSLLMMTYWLGRSLPVWMAPTLWTSGAEDIIEQLVSVRGVYRQIVGLALLWLAGIVLFSALHAFPHVA